MKRTTFIYGLKEKNGDIRYVGKSDNPKRRFRQHKSNARKERSHKVSWVNKCLNNNIEIEMVILEEVDYEQWREREIYWINQFDNLTNHDQGGRGGKPIKYKLSYNEAKDWVQKNIPHINSQTKWNEYKDNLPEFMSQYPRDTYINRGWISWGDFLGTGNVTDKNRLFLSYTDAKKYIKENLNIKNSTDYRKSKLPEFLPKKAPRVYKNSWVDWNDYLSTTVCKRSKGFVNYDEFTEWVRNTIPKCKTNTEYEKFVRNNKIPPNIPKKPRTYYKNAGWVGWKDIIS